MKKSLCTVFIVFIVLQSVAQIKAITTDGQMVLLYPDGTWKFVETKSSSQIIPVAINQLEIPKVKSKSEIIEHKAYSLSYNEKHEQANWVAYELTAEETVSHVSRTDKFVTDPLVKSGTASHKDYASSGYDKGHLAPAADMSWSSKAMQESFYYSNMSPQKPGFNRGVWKRLEQQVRDWAIENESVYIVTGPVLKKGLATIGSEHVSVPEFYYKIVLDYKLPSVKAIGFLLENASSTKQLSSYNVSIDSLEKLTGIDFFPQLPNNQEDLIECEVDPTCWTWNTPGNKALSRKEENR